MKDFSPKYFTKKYEAYQATDRRSNIQRYFKLFSAKFDWENGNETNAKKDLENIYSGYADTAHEKLFIARLFESLAKAYEGNNKGKFELYSDGILEYYPQLIPFSGITCSMSLAVSGANDAVTEQVINDLKNCNINFNNDNSIAKANIVFNKKGSAYEAVITAYSNKGIIIAAKERLIFKKANGVGGEIALRLFGKGGALIYEPKEQK